MGCVYRKGKVWWAQYKDARGERCQVSLGREVETKQQAKDELAQLMRPARERRLGTGDGKTNGVRLKPLLGAYMEERSEVLQETTLRTYRASLANVLDGLFDLHVEPISRLDTPETFGRLLGRLGKLRVSDIGADAVSDWRMARRGAGASLRTASMDVGALQSFLAWAQANGKIRENVLRHTKALKKKGDDRRRRAISEREAMALVAVSPPRLAVTWRMFLLTGLRSQELINLTWRDLTLEPSNGKKPKARIRKQKNQKGAGSVILYPQLAADLAAWRVERPADSMAPVFLSAAGTRWADRGTIRRRLRTWARNAGMSLHKLTTHSLRHSYGALASHKNVSIGHIKATLRHSTLAMVAHYMHDDDNEAFELTGTMEELDQVLHELTPEQAPERIRELVAAVKEEAYGVPEMSEADDMPERCLQSADRRLRKRA